MTAIVAICRDESCDRTEEMTHMINMLGDSHIRALSALAGSLLATAHMGYADDKTAQQKYYNSVRDMVMDADEAFSLELRRAVADIAGRIGAPDPCSAKETATHLN